MIETPNGLLSEPHVPDGDSADAWGALREFELRREAWLVSLLRVEIDAREES